MNFEEMKMNEKRLIDENEQLKNEIIELKERLSNYEFNGDKYFQIRKKIASELSSKIAFAYIDKVPASYSPYSEGSFHDKFDVYDDGYRIARFNNESEAESLVIKLNSSRRIIRTDDERVDKLVTCPECGSRLDDRTGIYGDFVGCTNYPVCNYSRKNWVDIEDEMKMER